MPDCAAQTIGNPEISGSYRRISNCTEASLRGTLDAAGYQQMRLKLSRYLVLEGWRDRRRGHGRLRDHAARGSGTRAAGHGESRESKGNENKALHHSEGWNSPEREASERDGRYELRTDPGWGEHRSGAMADLQDSLISSETGMRIPRIFCGCECLVGVNEHGYRRGSREAGGGEMSLKCKSIRNY